MPQIKIHADDSGRGHLLLELQGTLEFVDSESLNVGTLEWTNKDTPVLLIGHHRLVGHTVPLAKPFALLEKTPGSPTSYQIKSVIKTKCIFKSRPEHMLSTQFVGLHSFTKSIR